VAVVSAGTLANLWPAVHASFPAVRTRAQKREIQNLARLMASGELTAEEAVEKSGFSPELVAFLKYLLDKGFDAAAVVLTLLAFLQAQAWHEEDQRERERDRAVQRETTDLFRENFEQLHRNEEELEARLRRVEEARLVEEEEDPPPSRAHSQPANQVESASLPTPRSPEPKPKKKSKKGKKRA
jgi:hypothetical protein